MQNKFKVKLNVEGFDKLIAAPKWLDKLASSQTNYEKALKATNEENSKFIKLLKEQNNNSASIWLTQKKMNLQMGLTKLKNPFPLLIKGTKMFGSALKGIGIGVIIAALGVIAKIGKKAFDFNIGGSKTGFVQVLGKITKAVADLTKRFYSLVRSLDPILKPLTNFLVDIVFKGVDGFMELVDSIGAAMGGMDGIKKLVSGIVTAFMSLVDSMKGAFSSFSEGFGDKGEFAKGLGSIITKVFKLIAGIFKLLGGVIKLLDKFGLFKAIGMIFKGIMVIFDALLTSIMWLVDGLVKISDGIDEFSNKHPVIARAMGMSNVGAGVAPASNGGSGTTNNVSANAQTNIYTQSVDKNSVNVFSDIISKKLQEQARGGY